MDAITVLPPNSLAVVEQPFNVAAWEQEGKAIFDAGRVATRARRSAEQQLEDIHWKVGDWLLAGEKHLKDATYEVAEKATGHAAHTLLDFARVARAFPTRESRHRDKLTWSHFKELATSSLTVEQRDILLAEAQTRKLSIPKLRAAADRLKTPGGQLEPAGEKPRTIKLVYDRSFHKLICRLAWARDQYPPENMFRRIFREYFAANRASIEQEIADFEAKDAKSREEARIARKARKLAKANEPPKPVASDNEARILLGKRVYSAMLEMQKEFGGHTHERVNAVFVRYVLNETGNALVPWAQGEFGNSYLPGVPIETLTALVERLENAGNAKAKMEFLRKAAEAQDMRERAGLEAEFKRMQDFRAEQRKLQDRMRRDAEKAAKAE
jgi:hypothetical protein